MNLTLPNQRSGQHSLRRARKPSSGKPLNFSILGALSLGALSLTACETISIEEALPAVTAEAAATQQTTQAGDTITLDRAVDHDQILGVIDSFFEAVTLNDSRKINQLTSSDAVQISIFPENSGRPAEIKRLRDIADDMRDPKAPTIEEPYWDPIVLQRKTFAIVWTPYEFWINNRLSHCGINVFTLTFQKTEWRISGIQGTQEPGACEELWPEGREVLRPNIFNDNG